MKPYRFRLATVQRLREAHRDALRQQLGDANRAAEVLEAEANRLEKETQAIREALREATRGQTLDVGQLLAMQRYELKLRADGQELAGKQREVEKEIERRRQTLVGAEREVRVLELLDERQRAKHRQLAMASEQKELDEMAGRSRKLRKPTSQA